MPSQIAPISIQLENYALPYFLLPPALANDARNNPLTLSSEGFATLL
jgi:hypothetical protein